MRKPADYALDAFLAASARSGDREGMRQLAKRWYPLLTAHAWRLTGNSDTAQDAVQEAWVEIVRGLPGLRDDHAFAAWAYRITTRRCARLIGQRQSDRRLAQAVEAEPRETSFEDTHDEGDAARLKRAMGQLPPDQRAAVALFHLQGLSVAETAIALDVPAGTVKTRLMHARRKLRDSLEGGNNE
ncbi:MAG: RNA polymerase ECF subfamily sigma 70 factor [Oceanicaulis sp. HLUCCA04]|nr:MAG: RNA polymerase ECF subfamily sigma 70 factor [Oceanicaulis sp. HLUCCA04]